MADTMQGLKRTHYCGEVTEAAIGSEVVVSGWVQRARNLGNLIFIDLRDRRGPKAYTACRRATACWNTSAAISF